VWMEAWPSRSVTLTRPVSMRETSDIREDKGVCTCDCNAARQVAAGLRTIAEAHFSAVVSGERLYEAGFFRNCATVFRISREGASSDTARARAIAPTSALKVRIALDLAVRLFLAGLKAAIN